MNCPYSKIQKPKNMNNPYFKNLYKKSPLWKGIIKTIGISLLYGCVGLLQGLIFLIKSLWRKIHHNIKKLLKEIPIPILCCIIYILIYIFILVLWK
jgi:hypothetical protein